MANDYIPRGDAEFNGWQANFVSQANANLAGLGLLAADLTPIQTAQGAWATSYTNHITLQAIAQSTRQTKDDTRASLESLIRALVRRLQASPDVSDPERQALGITVTDATGTAAAAPGSRPLCRVDSSELTFLAVDTRAPYLSEYPGGDGGKMAHYMLRWINTRGETGPWSETVSATIGA